MWDAAATGIAGRKQRGDQGVRSRVSPLSKQYSALILTLDHSFTIKTPMVSVCLGALSY